jgi:hypothetical protein
MKKTIPFFLVFFNLSHIITSCDPSGNLFLVNGYPHDVLVYGAYEYKGEIYKKIIKLNPGNSFAPAGMGHIEYNHIISISVKDMNEALLAEYTPEYISQIRKVFRQNRHQQESWIFTERGLFFETLEVSRRYKFEKDRIIEYYRSEEAVNDLDNALYIGTR